MSRRDQLQHLIDTRAGGNQAVFAPMIHRKPPVVWQYLSGYREMGEKFARHIEQCLHLPHGWMDLPSTANLPTTTVPTAPEPQPIAPYPREPNSPKTVTATLEELAALVGKANPAIRDDVLRLAMRYVANPAEGARIPAAIEELLKPVSQEDAGDDPSP